MTREQTNTHSLLAGDTPADIAGLRIRPMTLSTLTVLELLGNPIASAVQSGQSAAVAMTMYQISEFVWVHTEEENEVRRLTLAFAYRPDEVRAAVLDRVAAIRAEDLPGIMGYITGEKDAVAAASVTLLPHEGEPSKNGHGQPCAPASSSPLPASPAGLKPASSPHP